MRLNRNIKIQFFALSIVFSLLSLVFFAGSSLAAPGVKITKPANGSTVSPGQEITVTIESIDGFVAKEGVANMAGSPLNVHVTSLPITFTDKIPMKALNKVSIDVFVGDEGGNMVGDMITLNVQQTATLQSLEVNQDEIWVDLDWDGNISAKRKHSGSIVTISGIYSDGITRNITYDPNTIYASSDSSIVSVDNKGDYKVYKAEPADITVSNSGIAKTIPLVFHKPSGIRPEETIPPTTSIDIQPPANSAGWYNKDITITITAKDNESGSGVEEIDYEFPYLSGNSADVKGSQVVIPFSEEGTNLLRYVAYDNERNSSGQQSTEIHLDKTPPEVSLSLDPYKIKLPFKLEGRNFFMPFFYKLSYAATDKISGVKEIRGGLVIPDIKSFKAQLNKGGVTQIVLNDITKNIVITAPNPQEVLDQLKANQLFLIDNNQIMHLNERPKKGVWTITKLSNYLIIKTPVISFKVEAKDNADNVSTKDIKYTKTRMPLPDYVKSLISKKELSSEDIEDLEEDAVVDPDTLKSIRKNYR